MRLRDLIPKRYRYPLSRLKASFHGRARSSYSQFGEDTITLRLLPQKHGTYVDVGAHHPTRYSNTHLFHARGWRGVNIDPNPRTIKLFERARPADANICVGIATQQGSLPYYQFSDPAVNTFVEKEAEKWMHRDWLSYLGVRHVAVRPLGDVLAEVPWLTSVDLLTVDAEGMDLAVLVSNDWERFAPNVIVIECHDFPEADYEGHSTYRFLHEHGYALKERAGPSLIFTRK